MEEERNIKWVLIISIIMLFASLWVGVASFYSYPPRDPSALEMIVFVINRSGILLFIVTIGTSTLYTTGFRKDLMFKMSIYLFIISMTLFLISILKWLFTYP